MTSTNLVCVANGCLRYEDDSHYTVLISMSTLYSSPDTEHSFPHINITNFEQFTFILSPHLFILIWLTKQFCQLSYDTIENYFCFCWRAGLKKKNSFYCSCFRYKYKKLKVFFCLFVCFETWESKTRMWE